MSSISSTNRGDDGNLNFIDQLRLPNVVLIGTGEYTTGYVHGAASNSDKGKNSNNSKQFIHSRMDSSNEQPSPPPI